MMVFTPLVEQNLYLWMVSCQTKKSKCPIKSRKVAGIYWPENYLFPAHLFKGQDLSYELLEMCDFQHIFMNN